MSPPSAHFSMSFLDSHLQRRMSHRKGDELLPMLGARQAPGSFQPFVKRSRRQWREQSKNGQPRGPGANFFQRAFRDAYGVVIHAENKRSDGVNVASGQPLQYGGVFAGLVETLVDVGKIGGIDGLHADKDPLEIGRAHV